ncbi:MAG: guanylate kinase [Acetobacteraceae bacterium]|nr:guanylate kinase [Acetobacteraceae bacterium]
MIARRGVCLVLAAASGTGKTSLSRRMIAADSNLALSISMTTRAPRDGEVDGVHYLFRTQAEFDALVAGNGFLEHAHVFGRSYGTPRAPMESALAAGHDVLFDIDWQGHRLLRAALPGDVVGVFILPPSVDVLASRLRGRGDPADAVARRMAAAVAEMSHAGEFDHVLVNDDFDTSVGELTAILGAARSARHRLIGLGGVLAGMGVG